MTNLAQLKSTYNRPSLAVYGSFSQLTASGSAGNPEATNPQGNPAPPSQPTLRA